MYINVQLCVKHFNRKQKMTETAIVCRDCPWSICGDPLQYLSIGTAGRQTHTQKFARHLTT